MSFDEHRPHLHAVATRILGSSADADDAVQEAWLRYDRADTSGVENLGGWLTTVVSRLCLDQLRARRPVPVVPDATVPGPEDDAVLVDAVGAALVVVLESLSPDERLAFVLHDLFGVPFDEIGVVLDKTPVAARQLASRARRRVRGGAPTDLSRRREVVAAFLAASREGDFTALLSLLHPDVVLRADAAVVAFGAAARVSGPVQVAETFAGRARGAQPALVDGLPGLVWLMGDMPRVVFAFTIVDGLVTGIDLLGDVEGVEIEV